MTGETTPSSTPSTSSSSVRRPGVAEWALELLDVLDVRRVQVMRTALGIVLAGLLVSLVQPDVLAPSIRVGLLVGLAAVTAAAAVAFTLDSADPLVRGPRHVRGSGGALLVHGRNAIDATAALCEALEPEFDDRATVRYGIVEVGYEHALCDAMAEEIARVLAGADHRVILADLTAATTTPGISEVVLGRAELAGTVQFVPGLTLARLGAGQDVAAARRTIPTFLRNLPPDIDAVVTSLPGADALDHVNVEAFEHVFVLAVRNVTRRLDLVSTLDTLEPTGVDVHVLLVDPRAPAPMGGEGIAPLVTEPLPGPLGLSPLQTEPLDDDEQPADPYDVPTASRSYDEDPDIHGADDWGEEPPVPRPGGYDDLTAEIRPLVAHDLAGDDLDEDGPGRVWDLTPDPDDDVRDEDDLDPDILAEAFASGEFDIVDGDERPAAGPDDADDADDAGRADLRVWSDDDAPDEGDDEPSDDARASVEPEAWAARAVPPGIEAGPGPANGRGDRPSGGGGERPVYRLPSEPPSGQAHGHVEAPSEAAPSRNGALTRPRASAEAGGVTVQEAPPSIVEASQEAPDAEDADAPRAPWVGVHVASPGGPAEVQALADGEAIEPAVWGHTLADSPPAWAVAPPVDVEHDDPIGQADDDEDDPLGMTAALHSFTLERLDGAFESPDDEAEGRRDRDGRGR